MSNSMHLAFVGSLMVCTLCMFVLMMLILFLPRGYRPEERLLVPVAWTVVAYVVLLILWVLAALYLKQGF